MCDRAGNAPERLVVDLNDTRQDELVLVGPSMWGSVYRSADTPSFYRVIPIEGAPLEMRHQAVEMVSLPRQMGVAPVVEATQTSIGDHSYFSIRYELPRGVPLAQSLRNPDTSVRLELAAKALAALSDWRWRIKWCFLPMPADIVLADDIPHILAVPQWGIPDVEALFSEPSRIPYMAPQILAGSDPLSWQSNADVFAMGVMLLQCFFRLPSVEDPEQVLHSMVTGCFFEQDSLVGTLPFWTYRSQACQSAISAVRKAIAYDPKIRSAVDPVQLASELDRCRTDMQPTNAVNQLREAGRHQEAFQLLMDVLLDQSSYELLVLGADMAMEDLGRPLQSIDLYERAIEKRPYEVLTYRKQFQRIAALQGVAVLLALLENRATAGQQLDEMMWRDYNRLEPEEQVTYEALMATHFLDRGQHDAAAAFIYPRIFAGGKHLWGKFEMNVLYARALVGQQRFPEALQMLSIVKWGLATVRDRGALPLHEIQEYGGMVTELEAIIHNRSGQR